MFQAQQILSTCLEKIDISSTEGYDVFLSQLKDGLKNTSHETAANHKVAKVSLPAPAGVHMTHLNNAALAVNALAFTTCFIEGL